MSYEIGIAKLAGEIAFAEAEHRQACLNGSTLRQVGTSAKVDHYKTAFALVTGTAVNGLHFKASLDKFQNRYECEFDAKLPK